MEKGHSNGEQGWRRDILSGSQGWRRVLQQGARDGEGTFQQVAAMRCDAMRCAGRQLLRLGKFDHGD